ncbi:MAG: hypothetical protein ACXVCP_11165 [Bdellovibrio sp.]
MPYIITPKFKVGSKGEWFEGPAYERENIHRILEGQLPPVHYDSHKLKPHSLTHIESPKHTQISGKGVDTYIYTNPNYFFGGCLVLKFENNNWLNLPNGLRHKIISFTELEAKIKSTGLISPPKKVLISVDQIALNEWGFHDPKFIVTLSLEAAQLLTSFDGFNLYGTSWKSSDYQPQSIDRPIHNELFKKALILENIVLNEVPEGQYFISCFPLPLEDAAESPVNAVLFRENELKL